ncbi:MAG: shikimate dehydrogenase [Balneolaceae bacterium]|nr:MAG: shikimate dehydrogenase [Balneolaceae bacterium]
MAISFREYRDSPKSKKPHILIVGYPLGHSLSPYMHNSAIHHYSMDAEYLAVELHPHELTDFISACNSDDFLGCNITLPYKQDFLRLADLLDEDAEDIGAINVLAKKNHQLVGFNTDIHGFIQPLRRYSEQINGSRAIVFGTGGSSKAVCKGLLKIGTDEIIQVSRAPYDREDIPSVKDSVRLVDYSQWTAFAEEASLIVNCTPLGMTPNVESSPVRESEAGYLAGKICYDLVYNPVQTKFLSLSKAAGGVPVGGLEMLIEQGSKAFEIWTGRHFPDELIQKMLKKDFLPL